MCHHTMVHEQMQFFLRGFRRDAHPMAILTGMVGALSAFYHDTLDINNAEHRHCCDPADRQMPTLVSMAYKAFGRPADDLPGRTICRTRQTSCA